MDGFFSHSQLKGDKPPSGIPQCGKCGLSQQDDVISPKMPPSGKGRRKILLIGESPGSNEDKRNIQFIGKAGDQLRKSFLKAGIKDIDTDCWKTNACCCRKLKKRGDQSNTPTDDMIACCRPNVLKVIRKYDPNVIVLLGRAAIFSVVGAYWREDVGTVNRWGNWAIPCRHPNVWLVPTVHPSFVMRQKGEWQNEQEWRRWFQSHLQLAVDKSANKPYSPDKIPDYKEQIEIIANPDKAAREIMRFPVGPIAFDYETNTLKPEGERTAIISCSISNGKKTIAYPWAGEAITATSKILRAPHGKIASNLKFEDRWTRAKLKHGVRNWLWDTMLASHVLDNRPGITGLKFQSFVRLGQEPYDEHIKPLLQRRSKENRFNRIDEIDMNDLLMYNGLDSLLEYKIAKQQNKERKI